MYVLLCIRKSTLQRITVHDYNTHHPGNLWKNMKCQRFHLEETRLDGNTATRKVLRAPRTGKDSENELIYSIINLLDAPRPTLGQKSIFFSNSYKTVKNNYLSRVDFQVL